MNMHKTETLKKNKLYHGWEAEKLRRGSYVTLERNDHQVHIKTLHAIISTQIILINWYTHLQEMSCEI